jgi:ketopantoate reductase
MKICVFGAGAIGSYLAVELSLAGHDVCVIARDRAESSCEVSADVGCPPLGFSLRDNPGFRR